MLFKSRQRKPSMARPHTVCIGALLLVSAKLVSIWIVAGAYAQGGGDWWAAALVSAAAFAPTAALELAALATGYRFARRFLGGPALDAGVEKDADTLSKLLYACFFASSLGLLAVGYILGQGLAAAAPVMAPLAPLAIASGALQLLASAVRRGAALEEEARDIV
jgi:hypothetical protein